MNIRYSYTANTSNTKPEWLLRGYTGHEHLPEFNLINMNGRMYDPLIARMLSPDNYVQEATSTQAYNRYSYAYNNPLKYTDPSGDFIFTLGTLIAAPFTGGASLAFLPAAIGADLGMWSGGSMANGTMNPFKWDYSSGKTWGYMAGGALAGAASGYIGGEVATSGMPFANTTAIIAGSAANSMLTTGYTNFQTDVSVDFGIGSFNATKGTINGLWNWNNLSTGEGFGYSLGAMANVSDVFDIYANIVAQQRALNGGTPLPQDLKREELGTWRGNFFGPSKKNYDPRAIKDRFGFADTKLEKFAYNHDIVHFDTGTNGIWGTLLSTNPKTIASDIDLFTSTAKLVFRNPIGLFALNMDIRIALATSVVFAPIIALHTAERYSFLLSIYHR